MNVFEDLARGGSATTSLGGGLKVERLFVVDNIEGNPHDIIPRALSGEGIPKPGEIHPSVPRVRCKDVNATPIDSNKCEVTATYETLSFGSTPVDEEAEIQISINSSIQSVQTNQFFEGTKKKIMQLEYTFPADRDPDGEPSGKKKIVVPTAERQQAIISISLSRLESEHPLTKTVNFTDRINSKSFLGTPKHTWLCSGINGISADSGETYQVSYEFQFRADTWSPFLIWSDKNTGEIPSDLAAAPASFPKGARNFRIQGETDFGKLKLEKFGS